MKPLVDGFFDQENRLHKRLRMLVQPSGVDVFRSALRFLSAPLRTHRHALGTRRRPLSAGRQASLILTHLLNGQPHAQLAAGFGISTTTVCRYITEAVDLLAALAPALADAVRGASMKAYLILDRTPLPIDGMAADRLFYSGKDKKHGMNVQDLADPKGPLPWASPALPAAVHDVRAARQQGITDALAQAGINCRADEGYQGAGGTVCLPDRGSWASLPAGRQAVIRSHGKARDQVEQAIATFKSWRLLRKLRCSTTRITSLVQAVLTLHPAGSD